MSDFSVLCRGSAGASAIRRSGGYDLAIDESNNIRCRWHPGVSPSAELAQKVASLKPDTVEFLKLEQAAVDAGHLTFDQDLAVDLACTYINNELPSDPFHPPLPIGLTGGGGYGKTYSIGRIISESSATKIIVVAPTNAAVSVLRNALGKQGVFANAREKQIKVSTAHKALLSLALTPLGSRLFNIIAADLSDLDVLMEDDAFEIESINKVLCSPRKRGQDHRVLDAVNKAQEAAGKANFPVLAMRTLSAAGFKSLDPRFCYWSPSTVGPEYLVIIDEVGMVGSRLVRQLLDRGAKVILSGDPYQLPPVSTDFVDATGQTMPDTSAITMMPVDRTIHLQSSRRTEDGSLIPDLASKCFFAPGSEAMRNAIRRAAEADPDRIHLVDNLGLVPVSEYSEGPFLCWTNRRRLSALGSIRRLEGRKSNALEVGETLICHTPAAEDSGCLINIPKNERVKVRAIEHDPGTDTHIYKFDGYDLDEYGIDDAEDLDGTEIIFGDPVCDDRPWNTQASQWMEAIANVHANCRSMFWGDDLPTLGLGAAMTVHKAQGSGWPVCVIDARDILGNDRTDSLPLPDGRIVEGWRRLLYVALTRTSDRIYIIV
jgi:hypothetical protein